MKKFKLLFLLFSLNSLYGQDMFSQLIKDLETRVKKIKLKNGITVVMYKRGIAPTVSLYTKFKVGGSDETLENSGTAHLLEHMLFKGTKKIGTSSYEKEEKYLLQIRTYGQELDSLNKKKLSLEKANQPIPEDLEKNIEKLSKRLKIMQRYHKKIINSNAISQIYSKNGGVGFNAYTTNDLTNYQISIPANRIELWAKIESERLQNPVLREFYTERNVVQEERRLRVENRGPGILREKYLEAAFGKDHPYGIPVIGYKEKIPFLDIDETYKFFKHYYRPSNMTVAIVGNFDFEPTEKIIRENFENIPNPKEPLKETIAKKTIQEKEKRVQVEHKSGPMKIMGWHKPSSKHADSPIFQFIDYILSGGASSRLYKRLVLKDKLALSVGSWAFDPGARYDNLFSIFISNQSDANPEEIEKVVLEEIDLLKKQPITENEVEKIKNQLITNYFLELKSNANIADNLSLYETITGDWKNFVYFYQKLSLVKPEDITRVLNEYITNQNMIVGDLKSEK